MAKNQRVIPGNKVQDPSVIATIEYNEPSGAQKNIEVGRHLKPIKIDAATWSTDATAARRLESYGVNLAVYNNAGAVGSVTLGDDTYVPTSQAPGAVQAGTEGRNVGIACPPNAWTYIACADQNQVIASAATLLVYIIDDPTTIKQEASR